ncbi:dual serine/threonine and tyrosine protein kinase-like [Limulus polyphemus]|uniref:Dual serine/threonine and tyrosine protein kinase n=1 Tax=Limulus polyphemus TaxID=6850 RepID=A0ABM1C236_LIMPO|nr:dual serine/threonine and tyrosine protein kinase-like [Limulus polyphemus]
MKQLIQSLLWKTPRRVDIDWKRKVASDMLASLGATRLARSICAQFQDRLKSSHEQFTASLRQLESIHSGRLQRTEEHRIKVRKMYAPKIARYALESTSLRDLVLFGVPKLGREIGRGQYGVVYACDSWCGFTPCALKSVVPPDERHWNDLAMEFYYTRSIAEHERVVQIRGSVIDYSYGGGNTPAVLFIMERLQRDLYSAIKAGLDFTTRLQIALDVVQGIRFLHSQGLVHRDIKLKNVLLDKRNRAKITDLGFCKPEAMMSGSIVGTPIHMAPELLNGRYDNSVDVYAFGILLWYLCAGQVKLPYMFEQCQTKDQLWNCVRKGARPERLPHFDEECWNLMKECWATDPSIRPLLGNVEARLVAIMERCCSVSTASGCQDSRRRSHSYRRRHTIRNYHSKNQKPPVGTQHVILAT